MRSGERGKGDQVRAIVVSSFGDPSRLLLSEVPTPAPGPGEVRIAVRYVGVNYLDVHRRRGWSPEPPPYVPGMEAAGVIDAVGLDVDEVAPGDRVAVAMIPGSYAESMVARAERVVPVPDGIGLDVAAASLLQGMTAQMLAEDVTRLGPGDRALVQAAAGGTGALLVQLLAGRGATVYGVVSSVAKAATVQGAGADRVFVRAEVDLPTEVNRASEGDGIGVVFDSAGRDTFEASLACVAPHGRLVLFGQASGRIPPFNLERLAAGSRSVTFAVLSTHIAAAAAYRERAAAVFDAVKQGRLRISIAGVEPLERAWSVHERLEAGTSTGKHLLAIT